MLAGEKFCLLLQRFGQNLTSAATVYIIGHLFPDKFMAIDCLDCVYNKNPSIKGIIRGNIMFKIL